MFEKPQKVPKLALNPIMEIRTSIMSDEMQYRTSMQKKIENLRLDNPDYLEVRETFVSQNLVEDDQNDEGEEDLF